MTSLLLAAVLFQGSSPLLRAHSHNDYLQAQPLELAMSQGFGSVEADIFLVDGALLVAHDRVKCDPEKTLDRLYLKPLWARFKAKSHLPEILLVDIKADGAKAWAQLRKELDAYRPMLATPNQMGIRIVISGDRPRDLVFGDDLTSYDGRIGDIDEAAAWSLPLISESWLSHFRWLGKGEMASTERIKLRDMVKRAHDKGRKLRFWATPDVPEMWKLLADEGVDLIGTDKPVSLAEFLRNRTEG